MSKATATVKKTNESKKTPININEAEKKEKKPILSAPNLRYLSFTLDLLMKQVSDGVITPEQAYSYLNNNKTFDEPDSQNQFFEDFDFKATNKTFKDFIKSVNKVSIDADKDLVKAENLSASASEKAIEKEKEAETADEDKKKPANSVAKRARTAAKTAISKAETAKEKSERLKDKKNAAIEALGIFIIKHKSADSSSDNGDQESSDNEPDEESSDVKIEVAISEIEDPKNTPKKSSKKKNTSSEASL